ncbi:hypothetical protein WN944_005982 [Citrus x changshan-huyou]|uniref:Uncharacterized protein n=1 Tax=Citrus x changshan-huyou TaxID=2935761 RepID=A0AAP0MN65_9ROSI
MSNAYHNVFGYLIPALIGIVGANMQGTNERLLEHTQQMYARVSGSVSAVSLASTFVPRSDIGHIILYTAWLCSSIIIVVHQYGARFTEACRQLYNETLKPFCSQLYNETLKHFVSIFAVGFNLMTLPRQDNDQHYQFRRGFFNVSPYTVLQ